MFHTLLGKEKPLDLIHHSAVILRSVFNRVAIKAVLKQVVNNLSYTKHGE